MKNKIISILLILISSICICTIYSVYSMYINDLMKVSIFIIYLLFVCALYFEKKELLKILYFVLLFVILFVRDEVNTNINGNNYLLKWLKIIFTNKIVFVNIIGNIVLYMPFALIIVSKIKNYINSFIITTFFIVLFEYLQMILKRGVFDYTDIIINVFGVIIVLICYWITEVIKNGKKE